MRVVSCLALAALGWGSAVSAVEGDLEVGGFGSYLTHHQPDWAGERTLIRLQPWTSTKGQLELVQAWRGSQPGQLGGLAVWQSWGPAVWTFTDVAGSTNGDFLPRWRADAELHVATPHFERVQPFVGGGYADFKDQDFKFGAAGASVYLPVQTLALVTYRFSYLESDLHRGAQGTGASGRVHHIQLMLGPERGSWGQLDLAYSYGTDLIQDFITTGRNETFETHSVHLGWRRFWSSRFGTYIGADWAHHDGTNRDLNFQQIGGELRFIWHFGGLADDWAPRARHPRG